MLEEIKKLSPTDRFSLYTALIKLNAALAESVRGWDSWLRNPTFIETFEEEELKEIFKGFKDVCVKFVEEDIKWTSKKEAALGRLPHLKREGLERRYI